MFCTKCGTEMEEDYDFCPECGNPIKRTVANPQMINETGRNQSDESVPVRKKKNLRGVYLISAIAGLFIIVAAILLISYKSPARSLQRQLDLGYRYLSEMDYEHAIAAFEAAIEIDPRNADAYLGLADAYFESDRTESAIRTLERGLGLVGNADDVRLEERLAELEEMIADVGADRSPANDENTASSAVSDITDPSDTFDESQVIVPDPAVPDMSVPDLSRAHDITIDDIPDYDQLNDFLYHYYNGYVYKEYDYRNVTNENIGILERIVGHGGFRALSIYPVIETEEHWMDGTSDPRNWCASGMNSYAVIDGRSADWIATNIFHVSQSDLFELRWQGESSRSFYLDGSLDSDYKYYVSIGGIGGPSNEPNITSVKYDGNFFYLITESRFEQSFVSADYDGYSGPHYSIMGYEKIDGVYYWTLYYFTEEIPSDY